MHKIVGGSRGIIPQENDYPGTLFFHQNLTAVVTSSKLKL